MSEENKALVRRRIEVMNGGRLDVVDELYAPELAPAYESVDVDGCLVRAADAGVGAEEGVVVDSVEAPSTLTVEANIHRLTELYEAVVG